MTFGQLVSWNGLSPNSSLYSSPMNTEEKSRLFREIPSMLISDNINTLNEFHRRGQKSIRLHVCAHLCYARFYASQKQWMDSGTNLWLMTMAPLASLSMKAGLNQKRRFFGIGPYRK